MPWVILFCREQFYFAVTVVGHRTSMCQREYIFKNLNILHINDKSKISARDRSFLKSNRFRLYLRVFVKLNVRKYSTLLPIYVGIYVSRLTNISLMFVWIFELWLQLLFLKQKSLILVFKRQNNFSSFESILKPWTPCNAYACWHDVLMILKSRLNAFAY